MDSVVQSWIASTVLDNVVLSLIAKQGPLCLAALAVTYRVYTAAMQLVTPRAVAMAVRIEMAV